MAEPAFVLLQIRVPQPLNKQLRKAARARGETLTGYCRDLLRWNVEQPHAPAKPKARGAK